ncbi:hypothetical protein JTB14_001526 [Gonioctena quinquepunctata]|nr:hypothetical protein JTB14_001526 [Gonioctena quinquepunctata]
MKKQNIHTGEFGSDENYEPSEHSRSGSDDSNSEIDSEGPARSRSLEQNSQTPEKAGLSGDDSDREWGETTAPIPDFQ